MPDCLRSFVAAAAAALLVPALLGTAASRNFVPDHVFTGSTLTGWKPLGSAAWRAQNGEIIATPNGGGWLIADRAYQDVAFSASFRCADGCSAGVLLRAERTPDGGLKGIYASLVADDLVSYRVTIDSNGKETSRERLRPAGGGQVRVAPPPAPPPAPLPPHRRRAPAVVAARSRCRTTAAADARRYRAAHRPAGHRPAVRPVERRRTGPRRQHPARVSQRRRRLERWCRRRRVRALRCHRALRRWHDGGQIQGRGGEGSPAARRATGTGLAPLPDAGAQRVLLLVGALGRRHEQRRRSRHRRRALLLPRPRLLGGARDLHGEDARREHAVLQRRAVRARLHRRRMAGRDQFALHAADDPLRQPARRIPPLGELYRDRRHQQRDRAPQGHRRRRQARVSLQGQQQSDRVGDAGRGQSHRALGQEAADRTRPVDQPRHGHR